MVAALCVYLGSVVLGGQEQWHRLRVPAQTPTFFDMRSVTSAWECDRKGIDPLPSNPCDPHGRPANYPRLWLLPSRLGFGDSATVPLAVANALFFLAVAVVFVGRLRVWEGLVVALALCSPAVMLGVERGNVDLSVFAVLMVALMLFRRQAWMRIVSHFLFLLAAMLKIFPALTRMTSRGGSRWPPWSGVSGSRRSRPVARRVGTAGDNGLSAVMPSSPEARSTSEATRSSTTTTTGSYASC